MNLNEKYLDLKNKIINECENELNETNKLSILKTEFESIINSNRRLCNTNSLRDLIQLLEKIYEIHPENIQIFYHFVRYSKKLHLLKDLENYKKCMCGENKSSETNNFPTGSTITEAQRKCIDLLSKELGSHWRELARFLSFQESEIDEIESKSNCFSNATTHILQSYLHRTESGQFARGLRNALTMTKRKDLVLKINEML